MKDLLEVIGIILLIVLLGILSKGCSNGQFCAHWKYDNIEHQACLW